MRKAVWVAAWIVLAASGTAGAQESEVSSPFFDCPFINYFDSGCPELEGEEAGAQPPPAAPERPAANEADEDDEYEWGEENPEVLAPLFPRESLSRDTPEPYRLLLMRPTLENARRFVRWYARRMERVRRAQALIALAGGEYLAGQAAAE
ncbi:MAG: hypothetical protein OXP66_07515 [Candidatus Tectomicrobia bacterium]|nr:hypothetical protein [Candidatus Tectomicrobia bacterium]